MENNDELLKKIYDNSQKSLLYKKIELAILAVCAAALLIAVLVVVPRTVRLVNTIQTRADSIEATIGKANQALDDVSGMAKTLQEMGDEMDALVGENSNSLKETLEKMSQIDFEGLNKGIKDLQDAVGPFANFMKKFG